MTSTIYPRLSSMTYFDPPPPHPPCCTSSRQQDHRRHFTPRDPEDFAMRTGVPEDVLNGDAHNWTPEWALSLEERFQRTVKAWLRGPAREKQWANTAAAEVVPAGLAFVPTVKACAAKDVQNARANDLQKRRWMSLAELGERSCLAYHPSARAWRGGGCGRRCLRSGYGDPNQMLLGLGKRGFPFRRSVFSAPGPTSGGNSSGCENGGDQDQFQDGGSAYDVGAQTVETLEVISRSLEDPEPRRDPPEGLLSSLLGGAAEAYDSAVSFVGYALVTSPLGKRYLNAYDNQTTVPTSASNPNGGSGGNGYDLVGISNIDPFEASGRKGKRSSNRLLRH